MSREAQTVHPAFPETADIATASEGYAARFGGAVGAWMLAVQERIVAELLPAVTSVTVLDVGGGHGQLAVPLCRAGYDVTVVGSDERCRERIAEWVAAGRCRFVVGNLIALPFPERSFDVALAFRLLPHCAAWPTLIAELCRVARCMVLVDYPTRESLNVLAPTLFGAKRRLEGNTRRWRLFRHAEVAAEFRKHGYACHARQGQFFLPMVLHRVLHCRPLSVRLEALATRLGLTARWGSPVIVRMDRLPDQSAGAR